MTKSRKKGAGIYDWQYHAGASSCALILLFNVHPSTAVSAYGNVGLTLGYTCPENALNCVSPPFAFSGALILLDLSR